MKIHFFRHSFFKISSGGVNILVDPYIDTTACGELKPIISCPDTTGHLDDIDAILLTHEHFDHFEKDTVEKVAKKGNSFVVAPEFMLKSLDLPQRQLRPVNSVARIELKNAVIEAHPAHHPNSFYPLSYLIRLGKQSIFHAGDTSLVDYFSKIKPTVALLPIGGHMTMDVVDAVRAAKMMKPDYAIPMHYDTFEAIKADPKEFKYKIEKSILKTKPLIISPGQSVTI